MIPACRAQEAEVLGAGSFGPDAVRLVQLPEGPHDFQPSAPRRLFLTADEEERAVVALWHQAGKKRSREDALQLLRQGKSNLALEDDGWQALNDMRPLKRAAPSAARLPYLRP